jgi:hypothetical protein
VRPRRALSPDRGLLRRNVVLLLYGAPSATGVTSAGRSHCGAVKSSESPPELSVFAHFRTRPTASTSLDKPTSLADGPGCPWPRRGLGGRPTLDGLGDSSTAVSGVLERSLEEGHTRHGHRGCDVGPRIGCPRSRAFARSCVLESRRVTSPTGHTPVDAPPMSTQGRWPGARPTSPRGFERRVLSTIFWQGAPRGERG